jgi:DNA-binding NarL/FixJ family response regulator
MNSEAEYVGSQGTAGVGQAQRPSAPESLTSREIEILNLIFSGRASIEVAELLCVSKRTVDFHLSKAYTKLGVSNRVQAFKRALELGLIS